ncbi:Rrf2 family transcriptional regulator [Oxalobacteraceae bacterium OTU3CINTB1]|nr:Rrf2 family transcriptional regulator [Oxalobacteraceae bacterium OTU3CINTB1]
MRTDSRLSRMLHVLLHMARAEQQFTSDQIGQMLGTNAVVVRRTMAGLRKAGYVTSLKGHGGGWTIACDLTKTTLLDIYDAIGGTGLFSVGVDNLSPHCGVERVVNEAIGAALKDAEELLRTELRSVTLAQLSERFDTVCVDTGWRPDGVGIKSV